MSKDLSRCTFAIISHPDAGKTTVTEKLIWFGGVVREAGMVKAKSGEAAKSDWMQMEQDRGISITSSVMSYTYNNRYVHLLDTPGHKDFSEDTYRTLTAVESVLMMIDSAKGVEEQTQKLMEVCRLRDTPICTFMNKFDRESLDPFELIDNVEKELSIQCVPMTWPIGMGVDFKGVYDLKTKKVRVFGDKKDPLNPTIIDASDLNNPELINYIGETLKEKLEEDLMMVEELIPPFNMEEYLAGIQTPVFFGSALYNFGVKEVLDMITDNAPGPRPRKAKLEPFDADSDEVVIDPQSDKKFSGFVFKIQANMDKKHRDRIAFMRICSGKFTRNQKLHHVRTGKDIKIATPLIFQARDRELAEYALPGDIIGLHDTGKLQIGDTFTEGKKIMYTGIPAFAPELFKKVALKDPLKAKHLDKGLRQLSEEGATQLFIREMTNEKMLGAVGALQFEVVKFRLEDEYNVHADYEGTPFVGVRWLKFKDKRQQDKFRTDYSSNILYDGKDRICYGIKSPWDLKLCEEKNPEVKFFKNSDYIETHHG
ncbi:MAG: peptide chain release factor 3 [Halobacteriovoraceae bacterium]|nr:peptide chain release factor 3 [Halobacteriovoraceae bacterium]|tara:strand:- start:25128 stop:26744 length:1617 start_codon:yes stop_codon:yes gene_type:complete